MASDSHSKARTVASGPSVAARPTARIGWNNRSQTVTLPLEFRFPDTIREVYIRNEGHSVVLTPRPLDWSAFFASNLRVSADFMADCEPLPVQERGF